MPLTKTAKQQAQFQDRDKVSIRCDASQQRLIRELWLRKRITEKQKPYLGDYYGEAFKQFLTKNRVPKVLPQVNRQSTRIHLSPEAKQDLESISIIARKRKQSLSVVLEELLQEYLDKPENFLDSAIYKPQKMERIV
jgi:hypothetical protein